VDLKSLPQNTCPLCREPALALSEERWKCGHCGCVVEYDAETRHSRIANFPPQYAAFKSPLGDEWLTRRELFERVDEARPVIEEALAHSESSSLPIGAMAVVALTSLVLCIMLSAIAAAIVVSPAIARTRRAISAAYRPTSTALPATQIVATEPPAVSDSALLTPTVTPVTDSLTSAGVGTATVTVSVTPTLTPTVLLAAPTVGLRPTNTALPPTAAPPAQLPPTFTPLAPTPAPTVTFAVLATVAPVLSPLGSPLTLTVTGTPTVTAQQPPQPQPPPVNPPPGSPTEVVTSTAVPSGAAIFNGTIQVSNIRAVGDPNQAEADEYVEIRNIGSQPVYVDGWSLKAFVNNQQRDQYVFTNGAALTAGQVCRIYTNLASGPDNCGFAFGFANDAPLWPNGGGARASLFNEQNIEMSRFTY
jgi:ribosomal protein S27AE